MSLKTHLGPSGMKSKLLVISLAGLLLLTFLPSNAVAQFLQLPPAPPPEQYGNILINRNSGNYGVKPVVFSHWLHRMKYTCRVCHLELGFNFQASTTLITEKANREGKYCGACHNGKIAFGITKDNCKLCHNGDISSGKSEFARLETLPKAGYGNGIDWVKAVEDGAIKPKGSLDGNYKTVPFKKKLTYEVEWGDIPPAVFPHKAHILWLDCANCHPGIFNIEMKSTRHFSMDEMVNRESCGVCHLTVAFPLNDCRGCHRR